MNPSRVNIPSVFGLVQALLLLKGRVLHKEAWVAASLGTLLRI